MPLTFLTADRELNAPSTPSEVPLPYADPGYWRRPYRPGPWRVAAAAILLLLASYLLISAMIIALAGTLAGAGICVGVAALVIGYVMRMLRIGVWASSHGLRQVKLFRTTALAWGDIAAVRTVQQPVRWFGLPRTVQGQALIAHRHGDGRPRTLLTDHNADFLSKPEAFDRAADVVEAWAADYCGGYRG
ncbi:PH domain-containing protein [Streptomyces gobiensis]|uniref:PH domain-containing protein n=1 Tax=Streptomyces gobiensis TaxID=2875706 RepID=UPI001E38EEC8|nr:PH domain-containing protein [Streptomyces gobiensis]UGY93958.1 PH domain-containing protein [Streptomyces gobiensis]